MRGFPLVQERDVPKSGGRGRASGKSAKGGRERRKEQ